MTETLLSRVLADSSLRALEMIDEAPLEDLEHLIAHGPAAGVHPSRLRIALIRRAHMLWVFKPRAFPDKAALLARVSAAVPAMLEARAARYARQSIAPLSIDAARAALEPRACDTACEGALLLVERRIRLHDSTEHRPMDQTLFFVTGVLENCGVLFKDPELKLLPIIEGTPGKLWRGLRDQGVGGCWSAALPSIRARHMQCGLHPDGRAPGPALFGEETRTIIACA